MPEASKYKNNDYVWISRLEYKKIKRDFLEIKDVDSDGHIVALGERFKVKYIKTIDILQDLYINLSNQEKILVFKS